MLFNSLQYLIFLPLVALGYFITPYSYRWVTLFLASSYFYMVLIPEYILILYFIILLDYFAAILIENSNARHKRTILLVSIFLNIGVLCLFKYTNFFIVNIEWMLSVFGIRHEFSKLNWILPIGLSFHTFQSLSYTIDVYLGKYRAERHLGKYAVYVLFFPQMVAGPIERPGNLLPQLNCKNDFSPVDATIGFRRILRGCFKKIVIADNLAIIVDQVYGAPSQFSPFILVLATWLFAIQIYCDFSGYTDIALGSARILGIRLIENFNCPYFSTNISEFWRRWHISLSSWFKDYVYLPLGGSKGPLTITFRNILVVFLLSGLWHGASWTFVIWGLAHGVYLIIYQLFKMPISGLSHKLRSGWSIDPRLASGVSMFLTFQITSFAWIFFRANNVDDAVLIVKRIFSLDWGIQGSLASILPKDQLILCLYLVPLFLLLEIAVYRRTTLTNMSVYFRWTLYVAVIFMVILMGQFNQRQFIYFQF